ncbi:hypothetical protein OG394_06210 [Kribbella sp. NBC_01245]|uniref:hypothetical protein n=1 Tax=Kribbella sp. NBC_01245 TaxID=2903578 RepID=UPI002E2836DE|nr:hypothetical protein [Kribbella sp. NBC_01245]
MRRVERAVTPPSLDGPASAGGMELAAAKEFFKRTAGGSFEFKAYKRPDVRAAMRAMFHRKCAYCESFYAPVMPDDVEHYRPKAAYIDRGKQHKPGYWWLAMEWSNLLPSCADCNRARIQEIVGLEGRMTAGKANQFPLATGSVRGSAAKGVAREKALLLDPTVDNPAEHLEFLADGGVRPTEVAGKDSARGRTTINVVALQRRDLVDARSTAALATRAAIAHVIDTMNDIARFESMPGLPKKQREALVAEFRERLARNLREMEAKAAPETPYSAVAEAMITDFKAERGL